MTSKGPQWTRTESKVLQEWIKADSKKRPLGAHVDCCYCCYDRNCPCMVYIMCSILAATGAILFIIFCFQIVAPYHNTSKFVPARCLTQSSRFKTKVMCCYDADRCHMHECLEVNVTMMTSDGSMAVNAVLYQDLETLAQGSCSYLPECHVSSYVTKLKVEKFDRSYGKKGKSFYCMYNRQRPVDVVVYIKSNSLWESHVVAHVTAWPLLVIFVCCLSLTLTYFICGCQPYVWPSRPSNEVRAEAYSRDCEKGGRQRSIAREEEEVFRKFYAMQGMPVPPPSSQDAANQESGLLHSPSEFQAILDKSA